MRFHNTFKITNKQKIFIVISVFLLAIILYSIKYFSSDRSKPSELSEKIYNSMNIKKNRLIAYNKAVDLNNGSSANTCVYFISEVLRMNNQEIDYNICNTTQLLDIMKKQGWKKETDFKKLQPGDICFTTDEKLNKKGIPSHTYVFMGWKEKNKYDYAYICDNQAKDYDNMIYHIRNIAETEKIKNNQKEPFSFFMYK